MSSSFFQPSVTPVTALPRRARARPWKARDWASSLARARLTESAWMSSVIPAGMGQLSLPLAPSTTASDPMTVTFTPLGSVTGFFPIRDMGYSLDEGGVAAHFRIWLPDVGEDFAADVLLLGVLAREEAPRGGQDGDAEAAVDVRDLLRAGVDAQAGSGHAAEAVDHILLVLHVLQVDDEERAPLVLHLLEGMDVALLLQDAAETGLDLGGGHHHGIVSGHDAVADAGEIVSDGIGIHGPLLLPAALLDARQIALEGELAEAQTAKFKLAHIAPGPAAALATIAVLGRELRLARILDDFGNLGHRYDLLGYLRKGIPRWPSRARASASFLAVVTKVMFMPFILSTLE